MQDSLGFARPDESLPSGACRTLQLLFDMAVPFAILTQNLKL